MLWGLCSGLLRSSTRDETTFSIWHLTVWCISMYLQNVRGVRSLQRILEIPSSLGFMHGSYKLQQAGLCAMFICGFLIDCALSLLIKSWNSQRMSRWGKIIFINHCFSSSFFQDINFSKCKYSPISGTEQCDAIIASDNIIYLSCPMSYAAHTCYCCEIYRKDHCDGFSFSWVPSFTCTGLLLLTYASYWIIKSPLYCKLFI